jgi:hypothetical protein
MSLDALENTTRCKRAFFSLRGGRGNIVACSLLKSFQWHRVRLRFGIGVAFDADMMMREDCEKDFFVSFDYLSVASQ